MRTEIKDNTAAAIDTNFVVDSLAGTVSVTLQKVLIDKTDNSEANDGAPVSIELTPEEAKKVLEVANDQIVNIINSRVAAEAVPATSEAPAAETAPATEEAPATDTAPATESTTATEEAPATDAAPVE